MKKLTLILSLLTVCFFSFFIFSDGFAAGPVKPKAPASPAAATPQQTVPATSQNPKIPGGAKTIRRAQITSLEIGTDATGTWTWTATVKNNGTAVLNGRDLTVQGSMISFPPAQHTWQAASGSIVSQTNIAPNQSVNVTNRWSRCCLTTQLKVELRDTVTNRVWDTKYVSNLIYSTAPMKPLNIRVKRIEWTDSTKAWKATIKNNTNFTVKITVQGDYYSPNATPVTILPAGGQQLTLGPQAEVTTMQLHASNAKHGDKLRVHIGLITGPGACNETWRDCGGEGSNNITIPNSANF